MENITEKDKPIGIIQENQQSNLNSTIEEIQKAYDFQLKETDWTFYSERQFIETLFTNRFNFLIIIYSLFVTAFATIKGKENKLIILILGVVITGLVAFTIYRIYDKLMINLKILYKLGPNHVLPMIAKEVQKSKRLGNVNPIIAIYIPLIFIMSFFIAIILISLDIWKV